MNKGKRAYKPRIFIDGLPIETFCGNLVRRTVAGDLNSRQVKEILDIHLPLESRQQNLFRPAGNTDAHRHYCHDGHTIAAPQQAPAEPR